MDIRIYAFELNFGSGIGLDELFEYIQRKGSKDRERLVYYLENGGEKPDLKRIITTSPRSDMPDYIVGLSLTIRDVSAFCSLKANNGKLEVSAEQLASGTLMTDFNFFIIYKPTGRGLYQHYHHSQATTVFCKQIRDHYRNLRHNLVSEEVKRLILSEKISEKLAIKRAKKKISPYLWTEVIERPEAIADLINELDRIDTLTFEPKSYKDYTKFARPHQGLIKKVKPVIYFEKRQGVLNQCKEWAAGLFTANDIWSGTAKGVDINGRDVTIKLKNDYQVLQTYNYDDLVVTISLDDLTTSLDNATIINELLSLSQTRRIKTLLEKEAKQ